MTVPRVDAPEVQKKMADGSNVLLVCAYDSDDKFRQNHLDGALSFSELKSRDATLPKDKEIVFYCA